MTCTCLCFLLCAVVGGMIATSAAGRLTTDRSKYADINIKALIVSAPCYGLDPKLATPELKFAAKVLSEVVPKLILKGLPPDTISRNKEAVQMYVKDPLVNHEGARARVGKEMISEM